MILTAMDDRMDRQFISVNINVDGIRREHPLDNGFTFYRLDLLDSIAQRADFISDLSSLDRRRLDVEIGSEPPGSSSRKWFVIIWSRGHSVKYYLVPTLGFISIFVQRCGNSYALLSVVFTN